MTKKTNSLLFRLGINSLWTLKIPNFTKIFTTLRLEQAIRIELIKHKWDILSLKCFQSEVNIQVYESLVFSNKTKQKIFRYLKKIKNIKKVSEKFSINSTFINAFIKKIRILVTKSNSTTFVAESTNVFNLFHEIKKLQKISKYVAQLRFFNWIDLNTMISNILQLKSNKGLVKIVWNVKSQKLRFKLQKINGFLYFKLLSIFIENILSFFVEKKIKININNIWHSQGWMFKFLFKDKFILKLLFLACIYNNTEIFSGFIALQLKKNKNHKKILRKITLGIETFWNNRNASLRGIQLRVTGKLNGSMRKSKYHYSIGKVQLLTFKTFLNYSISISYTKFGIISTKFWILHGNK